jgi:para-aminobenzoate synthetase component 1
MSALSERSALPLLPGLLATAPVGASLCRRELTLPGGLLNAFEALRHDAYPWLLDSALRQPGRGRYSFAGSDPYLVLRAFGRRIELECRREVRRDLPLGLHTTHGDPLEAVRALLPRVPRESLESEEGQAPFAGGVVGYLGYELEVDPSGARRPGRDDLCLPDLALLFVDRLLVFDHLLDVACVYGLGFEPFDQDGGALADDSFRKQRAELATSQLVERLEGAGAPDENLADRHACVTHGEAGAQAFRLRRQLLATQEPQHLHKEVDQEAYEKSVSTIVDEIGAGNVYQGDLTQRMDLPYAGDVWSLYRRLRAKNPAPFAAFLSLPEVDILSSSPERFLRVTSRGELESCPIKGTRPRGANAAEDSALEAELAASGKDRAENLMIVDLVRNDLGRVCELGSIEVPQLLAVEPYATVFQMVSRVTGRLALERDALDAVRAAFPPGSMTGAPKIAAMRLLDRLEPTRRAVYSGAIGYLDVRGGADLSVVIRTILVRQGRAYLHVGGGVVADSQPAAEYSESIDKARALWAALVTSADPL